jgi:hypothetical protein
MTNQLSGSFQVRCRTVPLATELPRLRQQRFRLRGTLAIARSEKQVARLLERPLSKLIVGEVEGLGATEE